MTRFLLHAVPLLVLLLALFGFAVELLDFEPRAGSVIRLALLEQPRVPATVVIGTWLVEAGGLLALFLLAQGRCGAWWLDGLVAGWVGWIFRGPLLVVTIVVAARQPQQAWWTLAFGWWVLYSVCGLSLAVLARREQLAEDAAVATALRETASLAGGGTGAGRRSRGAAAGRERCGDPAGGNRRDGRRPHGRGALSLRVAAVGKAFPPHYYDQEELLTAFRRHWAREHYNPRRLERLHQNVLVGGRHLALPLAEYERLETWGQANDAWIRVAQEVGERAVRDALERAGLGTEDVDCIIFVTVTGVATPSIDARLVNRLRLPERVKRVPIFGLGCVAGAAGVARAADYVKAYPDQVAVLLSVELCSLTLQREDLSIPNLIATGLFGDGAAAAVVVGEERPAVDSRCGGPRIVASRSVFYPDTERVMGWDVSERGFAVVLSADVPRMVTDHLAADVDRFLADHGLERREIASWVCHPGGPKVLEAMEEGLGLGPEALALTWRSLREVGNLSSTSVLLVLAETIESHRPPAGSWGMMTAMGPGFCSELVLLRW